MKTKFKPLLAETIKDTSALHYPVLASPKLDGIRCVMLAGKAVSRNLKPIANDHIRASLERHLGKLAMAFDGELMSGATFQSSSSAIMGHDGEPQFSYNVFDLIYDPVSDEETEDRPFEKRLEMLRSVVKDLKAECPWLNFVEHRLVHSEAALLQFEAECLKAGFEGVMVRRLDGKYKHGRSTVNEGILLKLKRFSDAEAVVIGVEPLYTNKNEATKDALGHTKRSSAKDGMVALDCLGALVVRMGDVEFRIGTGFDSLQRTALWGEKLVGKIVKFKYQASGVKEAPRFPVFLGFRDRSDM